MVNILIICPGKHYLKVLGSRRIKREYRRKGHSGRSVQHRMYKTPMTRILKDEPVYRTPYQITDDAMAKVPFVEHETWPEER